MRKYFGKTCLVDLTKDTYYDFRQIKVNDKHYRLPTADLEPSKTQDGLLFEIAEKESTDLGIWHFVEQLPPRLQQVVNLRYMDGLTSAEIGQKLQIHRCSVIQILNDAYAKLYVLIKRKKQKPSKPICATIGSKVSGEFNNGTIIQINPAKQQALVQWDKTLKFTIERLDQLMLLNWKVKVNDKVDLNNTDLPKLKAEIEKSWIEKHKIVKHTFQPRVQTPKPTLPKISKIQLSPEENAALIAANQNKIRAMSKQSQGRPSKTITPSMIEARFNFLVNKGQAIENMKKLYGEQLPDWFIKQEQEAVRIDEEIKRLSLGNPQTDKELKLTEMISTTNVGY